MFDDDTVGCKRCGWSGQVKNLTKGESREEPEEGYTNHALLCPNCKKELAATCAGGVMIIENKDAVVIKVPPDSIPC